MARIRSTRIRGVRALAPVAALLLGMGSATAGEASVGATEYASYLSVWLGRDVAFSTPSPPALLSLPGGWSGGDAAAVITPGGDWPPGLRDRLVAALLDAGASVLELAPGQADAPSLAAALATLRDSLGAGIVVALGMGPGGEAALAIAKVMPGFAGVVQLGPGVPRLHFATAPAAEAWLHRAALFCDLLASAAAGQGDALGGECRSGLARLR